jgi:hypothetical protein
LDQLTVHAYSDSPDIVLVGNKVDITIMINFFFCAKINSLFTYRHSTHIYPLSPTWGLGLKHDYFYKIAVNELSHNYRKYRTTDLISVWCDLINKDL